jgi:hypothetical protein
MTSEMAFECLFVSRDVGLFRTLGRILRDLSISTSVCLSSLRALELLRKGSTDLIVIDWDDAGSPELVHGLWKGGKWRKPTVVAISSSDRPLPSAHVVLKKPVTPESGAKSLKDAYSRMLTDYRRHARHPLMSRVVATLHDGRAISVIVTDIGDGGVGLSTKEKLVTGDVLSFCLRLSGTHRDVLVHVRVLWTREYDRAGCEFLRIPPVDLITLHDWLRTKCQVKKPVTAG